MVRRRAVAGVGALLAGAVAGVLALSSCKDDRPTTLPVVRAPTTVKGPTRKEVLAKDVSENQVDLRDYERIPDLGTHTMYQTPDGEVWQKYANGLMIQPLRVGNKGMPQAGQRVKVEYKGMFPGSNEVFDQSRPDQPFEFVLGKKNSVIKGWTLAVSTMRPGGKIKVFIPPDLAYGKRGSLPKIMADQALIFEIELLSVSGDPVEFPEPASTLPGLDPLAPKPMGPNLPATKPAK